MGFIDGTHIQPEDEAPDLEDWWTVQSMIVSWILNTIEPSLRSTVAYAETAHNLWEDIKERFSVVNGPRIQQLRSDLSRCKQEGMVVATYFGKLKVLWDELANSDKIPSCTCGGCKCGIGAQLEKRREEEKVHQLLMGLDDASYGTVRSNILASDPLPSLNRVYAMLVQEERVRMMAKSTEERGLVVGLAMQANYKEKGRGDMVEKLMTCSHCGKNGHDMKGCFQLIGYPEWWGDRPKSEGKWKGRGCQGMRNKGNPTRANVAHASGSNSQANNDDKKLEMAGLTNEQWKVLVDMISKQKSNESEKMTGKSIWDLWIIDSGASNHMTGSLENLSEKETIQGCPVGLPDGERVLACEQGTVTLEEGLELKNVLYVPKLKCNLLSVPQLTDEENCVVTFTDKLCIIQDRTSRTLIGAGERKDGLYWYRGVRKTQACHVKMENQLALWHQRLGHPSFKIVQMLPDISGKCTRDELNKVCEVCEKSKQTRDKFFLSAHQALNIFYLIHCDLWGPYKTPSSCGASYFLTIVDDCSRAVWIYLLKEKTEVSVTLKKNFTLVERQYNKCVKMVRSDNGTEFMCLKHYFIQQGILHQTSCVGTPQQNGRVERKHRHILNVARSLRFQGNLPIKFWGECVLTAGYLINLTPSSILKGKTPYEVIHGCVPSYAHLRVFGSLCYAHNQNRQRDKFDSRSRKCVFVGYPYGQKGWKLFDLETETFFVSRDVHFFENKFPYFEAKKMDTAPPLQNPIIANSLETGTDPHFLHEVASSNLDECIVNQPIASPIQAKEDATLTDDFDHTINDSDPCIEASTLPADPPPRPTETAPSVSSPPLTAAVPLGRGHRAKLPSVRLRDFVAATTIPSSPSVPSPPSTESSGVSYPIHDFVNCDSFSKHHQSFLASLHTEQEPLFFSQAVREPRWRDAMAQEIHALELNDTWKLTALPPGKKALGCKWIYKIKYNSDGTIERFYLLLSLITASNNPRRIIPCLLSIIMTYSWLC